ncbi:unnamed protein product, partial [Ectocarpus sp. 4 AP-2014]
GELVWEGCLCVEDFSAENCEGMEDGRATPRVPRRRPRASFSHMATPPARNSFVSVGDTGGRREGRRSSFMTATPLAETEGSAGPGASEPQRGLFKDGSPWLGGRAESPATAASPLPATRGETNHFRRAEELWRKASKAREGSRRRTMGAAPTLEQRMAWRREQEEEEA